MKINAALFPKRKPNNIKAPVKLDSTLIVSASVIAVGLIVGAVSYGFNSQVFSSDLWSYFFEFSYNFSNKTYLEITSGLMLTNLLYFFVVLVMGTSAVGSYFVLLPTLIKSLGIGTLVCYLYMSFGLVGLEYCVLVLFPGKIIFLLVMLLLTQICFKMSSDIKNQLSATSREKVELKTFFFKIIIVFIILIISNVVDSLMILLFSGLFNF